MRVLDTLSKFGQLLSWNILELEQRLFKFSKYGQNLAMKFVAKAEKLGLVELFYRKDVPLGLFWKMTHLNRGYSRSRLLFEKSC